MRKLIVLVALVSFSAAASAAQIDGCMPQENVRLVGPALTVQQMEDIGLRYAARNPRAPQVAFAYGNSEWLALRGKFRDGDRFVASEEFFGKNQRTFGWGYALVRGRCLLGIIRLRTA